MVDSVDDPAPPDGVMDVRIDALGVVRLTWARGTRITAPLAVEAMARLDRAMGGRARPVMVDITASVTMNREARLIFARRGSATGLALLGRSAVDRVIANFAIGANAVPTRYFTSETAATAWLLALPAAT